jgi:hypothetical protein
MSTAVGKPQECLGVSCPREFPAGSRLSRWLGMALKLLKKLNDLEN